MTGRGLLTWAALVGGAALLLGCGRPAEARAPVPEGLPCAHGQLTGLLAHWTAAPDGGLAGPDVEAQTRQVFENVATVVGAAGCTMRDVIRLQTFLVSADDIAGYMAARQEVFPRYFPSGVYPPNTLLVISRLVRPEFRVEVEALAVRPTRPAAPGAARRRPQPPRRPARRR